MKWFRHESDAHTNAKMLMVLRKYGLDGYGLVWVCREIAAKEGNAFKVINGKDWLITISETVRRPVDDIRPMLAFMADVGLIERDSLDRGDLHIPKLAEYADDYYTRHKRIYEKYPNVVSSDGVRTKYHKDVDEVISYLNTKTEKQFRVNSRDNQVLVIARLKEGYTVSDLQKVVSNQCDRWLGDEKMEQYLRPSTLFRRSHIEGYLNNGKSASIKLRESLNG